MKEPATDISGLCPGCLINPGILPTPNPPRLLGAPVADHTSDDDLLIRADRLLAHTFSETPCAALVRELAAALRAARDREVTAKTIEEAAIAALDDWDTNGDLYASAPILRLRLADAVSAPPTTHLPPARTSTERHDAPPSAHKPYHPSPMPGHPTHQ